jgi:hypothetical protein
MIRGSTPTHIFNLPIDTSLLSKIRIIYAQDDKVLFKKEKDACQCEGCKVSVKLTQEETFLFDCTKAVQIQIRAATVAGDVVPSKLKLVSVEKCLDNEVL